MNETQAKRIYLAKIRETGLRNLSAFTTGALQYKVAPFHKDWINFRLSSKETLILGPRGHGKSTVLTVSYGLWRATANHDLRILEVSNTHDQAVAFLREQRGHIETNDIYRACYGDMTPPPALIEKRKWTEKEITFPRKKIMKEATITAVGVGGPIIGRHYDIILLDDVVDDDNSRTEHQRQKLLTWYRKVLLPCLEPNGEIHAIGTRYHPMDLYGHFLKEADLYRLDLETRKLVLQKKEEEAA